MKIFSQINKIQNDIGDSSGCKLYNNCAQKINSPWDRIFLIERLRFNNSNYLKKVFKKNRATFFLFLIRLNAKFRFRQLRRLFELFHIILETHRLIQEIQKVSSVNLVEHEAFELENSIQFYPSFKRTIKGLTFLNLLPKLNFHSKSKNNLPFSDSLLFSKTIEKKVIKKCVRKLENTLINSKIRSLYVGGTMNMFNRVLALIFLENNFEVFYKDHGLVRDCCAEFGIFSKAIPYKKGAVKAKPEIISYGE